MENQTLLIRKKKVYSRMLTRVNAMSAGPVVVETIVIFALTVFFVHYYGHLRRQNALTSVFVIVTWFLSFMIIFLLPIDISTTLYEQCNYEQTENVTCKKPWSYVDHDTLQKIWNVIYWSTQLLTWVILPFLQSYVTAAHFTIQRKILAMLKENAIVYGTLGLIVGVLLIYVIIKSGLNKDSLNSIIVTAANTWGLFILVLLLGYGLVDFPITVWNSSRVSRSLAHMYFKVAKLRSDMEDAKMNLEEVYDDVKKVARIVKYMDPLRKHVNTILKKCPDDLISHADRGIDDYEDFESSTKEEEYLNMKKLVSIHKRVLSATRDTNRTQALWEVLVVKTVDLEDIEDQRLNSNHKFKSSFVATKTGTCSSFRQSLEWWWKTRIGPVVLAILAVLFALVSASVVWSESSFFSTDPVLSVFAQLVTATGRKGQQFVITEIICVLSVGYLAVCAYYTIFKIRIFNYYYLAPHHHTDENSLLFCAMFLSRLTAPLCLNFLGLIHLDSHITGLENSTEQETAFTEVMGHMDVVPFIAEKFNVYFPCCLILLCLATLLRLGSRILHCFGVQQFFEDSDISAEYVSEGKELIKIERRRRGVGESSSGQSTTRPSARLLNRSSTPSTRLTSREMANVKFSRRTQEEDRLELIPADHSAVTDGVINTSRLGTGTVSRGIFGDV